MTATKSEPWFVPEQRARKAAALATVLRSIGATAEQVIHFTEDDKRETETVAAVNKGSDKTWRLVVEMLAGSSAPDALCPTCGIGDPDGVPGPRKPFMHEGRCAR